MKKIMLLLLLCTTLHAPDEYLIVNIKQPDRETPMIEVLKQERKTRIKIAVIAGVSAAASSFITAMISLIIHYKN